MAPILIATEDAFAMVLWTAILSKMPLPPPQSQTAEAHLGKQVTLLAVTREGLKEA